MTFTQQMAPNLRLKGGINLDIGKGERPMESTHPNSHDFHPKWTLVEEELVHQRMNLTNFIQALTLREINRANLAYVGESNQENSRVTINDFLKLIPEAFYGEDLNKVVDRDNTWICLWYQFLKP